MHKTFDERIRAIILYAEEDGKEKEICEIHGIPPCHWITVHRVIKSNGMLVRIKPKLQPSKRFQRRYVDSMRWGDTFQFRISGTGKVYMTGFTDDR